MKKSLTLALLSLIMVACSQEEPIIESATEQLSNVEETQQLCEIAKALAKSEISSTDLNYIATGVSLAVENGLDEVFYIKELLGEDSKIVPMKKQSSELEIMKFFSSSTIMQFYEKRVNSNKLMIYWPFHENWDGESKPVISFTPENHQQQHNIGYYLENGELKTVEVNLDYAMNNPVWIVCLSPIRYNQLPDFNNPKRLNLGETLNIVSRKNNMPLSDNFLEEPLTRAEDMQAKILIKTFTIKPNKKMLFLGNSMSYYFYGKCYFNGEECENFEYKTILIVATANEINNGVTKTKSDFGTAHITEGYMLNGCDLEFYIATTAENGNPIIPILPILPLSIEIPSEQNVIVSRNYKDVLNAYFKSRYSFSDSTTNLTNNIVWTFYLDTPSDI